MVSVFQVGVKRTPTLLVVGEGLENLSREALIDLANQYVQESIYFEASRVIKRKTKDGFTYAIIVLEPQNATI